MGVLLPLERGAGRAGRAAGARVGTGATSPDPVIAGRARNRRIAGRARNRRIAGRVRNRGLSTRRHLAGAARRHTAGPARGDALYSCCPTGCVAR
ncbi:hypothetical protein GCM10023322_10630 [Rugosimonospora acidiphila]|uniref:Uncharacterized protein n=1 Tax=Rugosimonospora acidiphila TaxID=556531 RepID=A0ABP9RMM0_9ACTN